MPMFSMTAFLIALISLVFGYLCGSIPFGVLLTRGAGLGDVRSIGSGNIGATNVLRTGRKDLAAATLILDALKGTAAVLIARAIAGEAGALTAASFAGLGAFAGHLFPVWLGFRGGKGAATMLGVLLGLSWPAGIIYALVWIGVAATTRYSSASSLSASVVATIAMAFLLPGRAVFVTAVMAALLWWMHRQNIARLRAGSESRIGSKS